MRKLILKMSISIDGFVGGPSGEIDWIFATSDAGSMAWTIDIVSHGGLHLMGSRTFKDMATWWPTSGEPVAAAMNEIPKAVYSRKGNLTRAHTTTALRDASNNPAKAAARNSGKLSPYAESWTSAQVVSGDLARGVARLKEAPGRYIVAHGGATFAQNLVATGLVDEFHLLTHPIALGRGLPLFAQLTKPLALKLVDTKRFDKGAVAHSYRLAAA